MPEWWIERGIGELRAVQVEDGRIVEARIEREGVQPAGSVVAARLIKVGIQALAAADGVEYLLPKGAPGITEGAPVSIEVTREGLSGIEPWKKPLARITDEAPRAAPTLDGRPVSLSPKDALAEAGWLDLLDEARSGVIAFAGGELRVALTAAMTVIDVDGHLPAAELAVAGARAAAKAIRRHGISGSIGVDLPTSGSKAARTAAAQEIDEQLPQPFERTAVNGFGFVQIVRPRLRPSMFELASDRAAFEARALLRAASREVGAIRLAAAPPVIDVLTARPDWIERLARHVGGRVELRSDRGLAMEAGHASRA